MPFTLFVALSGCLSTGSSSDGAPSSEAAQPAVEAMGTFGEGKARIVIRDGTMSLFATDVEERAIVPEGGVIATVTPVSGQAERILLKAASDHWEGATRADGSPALVVLKWETAQTKVFGSVTVAGPLTLPPRVSTP